jgi:hypothetical protein
MRLPKNQADRDDVVISMISWMNSELNTAGELSPMRILSDIVLSVAFSAGVQFSLQFCFSSVHFLFPRYI